jgi:hypothetical protein
MKMENAQTENSAAGWASELTDVLDRMRARADNAYCAYIGQLGRDECLGWEIKVERGKFGEAEMKAHCAAAEKLGRHRALHEAANMLSEVLRSNAEVTGSPDLSASPCGLTGYATEDDK